MTNEEAYLYYIFYLQIFILSSCAAKCPSERITYIGDLSAFPMKMEKEIFIPEKIEIRGEQIQVDQVITGPVCNDSWSGVVYVTCDIQLPVNDPKRFFWRECDFNIEDSTLVYVEAHKDKSYDNGCSCHD